MKENFNSMMFIGNGSGKTAGYASTVRAALNRPRPVFLSEPANPIKAPASPTVEDARRISAAAEKRARKAEKRLCGAR